MRTFQVSEFKAKCLAILDEVSRTGEPVTILKRGRPLARLIPPTATEMPYPQHSLRGTVRILGDILGPTTAADDWEAEAGPP